MPPAKGKRYDSEGAYVASWFEGALRFTDGPKAGQPFVFEDWQQKIEDEAFLVDPKTGLRPYQVVMEGVPKKNGKTQKGAGLALFGMAGDSLNGVLEQNPQVPIAAAARHQASELGKTAIAMCERSPALMRRLRPMQHEIFARRPGGGRMWWMASDVATAHGIKPSFSVIDELGSHKDEKLWTVIRQSGIARSQPMHRVISHVGVDRSGPLADMYDAMKQHPKLEVYGGRGRNGRMKKEPALMVVRDRDAGQLMYWYGIGDRDDLDPEDPAVWEACNPASWLTREKLGAIKGTLGMRESNFNRWHLNMWVIGTDSFLPTGMWQSLGDEELVLAKGATVYAGMDGAKKHDYGALGLCEPVFVPGDPAPKFKVRAQLFRAEDSETSIVRRLKHATMRADSRYRLMEAHYDPHFLTETADDLEERGLEMIEAPQTPGRMSVNTNLFRELVEEGRILHDADPELARHVAHAVTVETGENSWRVSKKRSSHKIDGLIAVMLAVEAAYRAWQRGDIGPGSGVQVIGGR